MSSVPVSAVSVSIAQSYQRHIIPYLSQYSSMPVIYVACSGGRDSMALLHACHQLGLSIHVIHINHKLQTISDDWQRMVERFCCRHAIDFDSVCLTWENQSPLLTSDANINEQQARTARYQAIANITGDNAMIALAHHANDQAETLLMNLCQVRCLSFGSQLHNHLLQQHFLSC